MFSLTNNQTPLTTPSSSKTSDPARVAFISLCLLFPSKPLSLPSPRCSPGPGLAGAAAGAAGARALPGAAAGGVPRTPCPPCLPQTGGPSSLYLAFTLPGVGTEPKQPPWSPPAHFISVPCLARQLCVSGESPRRHCSSRFI